MEENFLKAIGASKGGAKNVKKKSTQEETLALVEAGHALDEIAKLRSLTIGTICDHIEKLYADGKLSSTQLEDLIPERLRKHEEAIHAAFTKLGSQMLAPVHAHLKKKYSYDDLKIMRLTFHA